MCPSSPTTFSGNPGALAVVARTVVITTKDGPHGKKAKSAFIDRSYR